MAWIFSRKPKQRIDLNRLAHTVAGIEGKLDSQNIAQICEIQKIVLDLLADEWRANPRGVAELLERRGQS